MTTSQPFTLEEERSAWQAKLDEANAEIERLNRICSEGWNKFYAVKKHIESPYCDIEPDLGLCKLLKS